MSIREINKKIQYHLEEIKRLEEAKKFEETEEVLLDIIFEQCTKAVKSDSRTNLGAIDKKFDTLFKMRIVRKGREVICTLYPLENPRLKGIGKAKCLLEDEFDVKTGCKIAETRARANYYNVISQKIIDRL